MNSRVRQAAENLQREDLSAVDSAKAAAALILVLLEIYPDPKIENEFDYYRQVFQFDRLPSGTWPNDRANYGLLPTLPVPSPTDLGIG